MSAQRCAKTGKVRHATKESARGHVRSLVRSGRCILKPRPLHVFRCDDCGGWHVAHVRKNTRRVKVAWS